MPRIQIDRLIEQIRDLPPSQLERVRSAVDECLVRADRESKREAFHRELMAAGLVTHFAPHPRPRRPKRRLIEVKGKPLSEWIIEERR